MLKERTIGIEVFGRSSSYEPSDDNLFMTLELDALIS